MELLILIGTTIGHSILYLSYVLAVVAVIAMIAAVGIWAFSGDWPW